MHGRGLCAAKSVGTHRKARVGGEEGLGRLVPEHRLLDERAAEEGHIDLLTKLGRQILRTPAIKGAGDENRQTCEDPRRCIPVGERHLIGDSEVSQSIEALLHPRQSTFHSISTPGASTHGMSLTDLYMLIAHRHIYQQA